MPVRSSTSIPILVLGDWIVDEEWVLAAHESRLASLIAKGHFRAVGGPSARVRHLAGAGLIARLLFWYHRFDENAEFLQGKSHGPRFRVYGLGTWAERDDSVIRQMCHPVPLAGLNPFSLTFTSEHDDEKTRQLEGLTLVRLPFQNICTADEGDGERGTASPPEVGTTRVFRLYRYLKGSLALEWRIDFETRPRPESPEGAETAYGPRVEALLDALPDQGSQKRKPPFRYVVVEEVRGINTALFQCLQKKGLIDEETLWFLFTKTHPLRWWDAWSPKWGQVRLWFLRPKSLLRPPPGDRSLREPVEWFIEARQPAADAVEVLDELLRRGTERKFLDESRTVVGSMPRGLQCLAVGRRPKSDGTGDRLTGYYNTHSRLRPIEDELAGKETSIFTTLARELVLQARSEATGATAESERERVTHCFDIALELGQQYLGARARNLERLEEGTDFQGLDFDPSLDAAGSLYRVTWFHWNRCREEWRKAFRGPGIIADQSSMDREPSAGTGTRGAGRGACLQIWRAMGELPGYVETVETRRREIARLRRELAELKDRCAHGHQGQASAMLLAGPGSGKTFLAKKLAESLEMPAHDFNIVQLVTRENVIHCFNSIASAQAGNPGQLHLVVFDEINAKLQGAFVYDLFLSVIDDGTYNWQGRPHKLQPCVWLFLGTRLPEAGESEKALDFRSRLSVGAFHLDVAPAELAEEEDTDHLEAQIRRGFVYRGAMLLQHHNPDVQRVSAEVLRGFHSLPLDTSVRRLNHLASRFRDIRYGEVRRRNMPAELRQVLTTKPWNEWAEIFDPVDLDSRLVLIETEARPCSS